MPKVLQELGRRRH